MSRSSAVTVVGYLVCSYLTAAPLHEAIAPHFEENAGQAPGDVRFLVRAPGYAALFDARAEVRYAGASGSGLVRMHLLGGAEAPQVAGTGGSAAPTTLYGGTFGSAGTKLHNYAAIRYHGVYPGIDWVWHFREGALEFQFELAPGADPGKIRLAFTDTDSLRLDLDGNLEIDGDAGLHYRRPEAWQTNGAGRIAVPVAFRIEAGVVAFDVGPHDPKLALIIDPVVRYSRYLGGAGYDAANAVTTDSAGNLYVTGETGSVDLSSSNGVRFNRAAFVSKLSPDASQVLYTVMLAGNGNNAGKAIALDTAGNVWVAGVAGGPGFPVTSNALRTQWSGAEDAFVARLDANGALSYASYLGGSGTDVATGLAIDVSGSIYVAGYTSSVNFPATSGAAQTVYAGGTDAFLVKLAPGGASLTYATLLGGAGNDAANGISVDQAGNACIAGRTDSANLPVKNALQSAYGGSGDGLLACLNASGAAWSTVTYVGGSGPDEVNAITRDSAGNLYLAGDTYTTFKSSAGAYDAYAMKLSASGDSTLFESRLAASGSSSGTAIAVDPLGNIWVAGYTASPDFPVSGPPAFGGYFDGFVSQFTPDGKTLLLSGYLGGSGDDRCMGIALTAAGEAIVVGMTGSSNFPTTLGNAPAQYNAFVASVKTEKATIASPTPGSQLSGSTVTFTWNAAAGASAYWLDVNNSCVTCGGGIFGRNVGLATSQSVTGLPANGGTVYVRLWTQLASGWQYNDYSYTAASGGSGGSNGGKAVMTSPASGSALSGSTVTFTWSAGSGALAYWLDVNSTCVTCGGTIFGRNLGLATTQAVTGLPATGGTIYVRLWTQFASGWQYNDYAYTAASGGSGGTGGSDGGKAVMTSPASGSTLSGSTVTFTWSAGSGALAYWLDVNGTCVTCGGTIFGRNLGLATTQAVTGLPTTGGTIYVRLWTQFASGWQSNDYAYTAASGGSGDSGGGKAVMTSPASGSTLSGSAVTFTWSAGSGALAYWLDVNNSCVACGGTIFGRNLGLATSQSVPGLPTNGGAIYIRLWTQFAAGWQYNDYSYTASK